MLARKPDADSLWDDLALAELLDDVKGLQSHQHPDGSSRKQKADPLRRREKVVKSSSFNVIMNRYNIQTVTEPSKMKKQTMARLSNPFSRHSQGYTEDETTVTQKKRSLYENSRIQPTKEFHQRILNDVKKQFASPGKSPSKTFFLTEADIPGHYHNNTDESEIVAPGYDMGLHMLKKYDSVNTNKKIAMISPPKHNIIPTIKSKRKIFEKTKIMPRIRSAGGIYQNTTAHSKAPSRSNYANNNNSSNNNARSGNGNGNSNGNGYQMPDIIRRHKSAPQLARQKGKERIAFSHHPERTTASTTRVSDAVRRGREAAAAATAARRSHAPGHVLTTTTATMATKTRVSNAWTEDNTTRDKMSSHNNINNNSNRKKSLQPLSQDRTSSHRYDSSSDNEGGNGGGCSGNGSLSYLKPPVRSQKKVLSQQQKDVVLEGQCQEEDKKSWTKIRQFKGNKRDETKVLLDYIGLQSQPQSQSKRANVDVAAEGGKGKYNRDINNNNATGSGGDRRKSSNGYDNSNVNNGNSNGNVKATSTTATGTGTVSAVSFSSDTIEKPRRSFVASSTHWTTMEASLEDLNGPLTKNNSNNGLPPLRPPARLLPPITHISNNNSGSYSYESNNSPPMTTSPASADNNNNNSNTIVGDTVTISSEVISDAMNRVKSLSKQSQPLGGGRPPTQPSVASLLAAHAKRITSQLANAQQYTNEYRKLADNGKVYNPGDPIKVDENTGDLRDGNSKATHTHAISLLKKGSEEDDDEYSFDEEDNV